MSLTSSTALLVATLDLQLTHSVISAIRKADAESARELGNPQARGVDQFEPRQRLHPTPAQDIQPRMMVHPTPRILPRMVVKPTDTTASVEPSAPEHASHHVHGIEAPWKKLPWPEKIYPHPKIKQAAHQSDTPHKGTMIDFFC